MQPETQRLLEALQPLVEPEMGWLLRLPYHEDGGELYPFVWDGAAQGAFNLWHLLQAEGWSQEANQEAALENWQRPDCTGVVNGATWLLPSSDEAGILLDEATKTARLQYYQALIDCLQANLQQLSAFRLACEPEAYAAVVLVGQDADQKWISVAPKIPHATPDQDLPFRTHPLAQSPLSEPGCLSRLEPQLQEILAQLGTIQVYGYYGGGYNQVHDHRLIYAVEETAVAAIEQVLYAAGGIETKAFDGFRLADGSDTEQNAELKITKIKELDQFLHQTVQSLRFDRICFWDQEKFYFSGKQSDDRLGVVLRSRFTYNP